ALRRSQRLRNTVDAGNAQAAQRHGPRPHRLAPLGPPCHVLQSQTQCLIDELLEARATAFSQPLEDRGDVIIKSQGCTHTSNHKNNDVLMLSGLAVARPWPAMARARGFSA